jgi:hypothetical protein
MYYIYHIPGVKIGCTLYPKKRVKAQGYNIFEILEKHTDKNIAADREIELQKQYGYPVDLVKYNQTNYVQMGKTAGDLAVRRGTIEKARKMGAPIAWKLPRTEEQMQNMHKARNIGAPIAWGLPRTENQLNAIKNAQKIGCVLGGKKQGLIRKEQIRVPIEVYRKSDNSYVGNYQSVSDCARELNLKTSDIFQCLNPNKTQYSTKGYKFIKLNK